MRCIVVLYDEDCGFCRWSAERLRLWDRRARLRFVAIGSPEGSRILAPLDRSSPLASMHVWDGSELVSGGRGVPALLRELPGGRHLARIAEAFPRATDSVYSLIARNRHWLARLVGERACSVDPSRTA